MVAPKVDEITILFCKANLHLGFELVLGLGNSLSKSELILARSV